MFLVLLFAISSSAQKPDPKENPTWFIPSTEKANSEDGKAFCTAELENISDNKLYQTRTSEILIPESLPPVICIIFPFQPNDLRYGAGTKGECVNSCCVFRPPSKNIPPPPPNPTWFETTTDCSDDSSAVTKPIIMKGENGQERQICEWVKDTSRYELVEGKALACASGCCLFFAPQKTEKWKIQLNKCYSPIDYSKDVGSHQTLFIQLVKLYYLSFLFV